MPATAAARGDAISVYWPLDKTWYHGRIDSFDADSGECEVLYDDGERHTLNLLTQTKYKVKVKHGVRVLELIDVVRADHGHVRKQLRHIGDALRSISDKLPSAGCCSSREGWWSGWYADIDSAVEAGSVVALVKVTYELACQVRLGGVDDRDWSDIVSTNWWNTNEVRRLWFGRLRSVKTCEDLVSCVDVFKNKAVDWKKSRKLFLNLDDSCGIIRAKGSTIDLIKDNLRTERERVDGILTLGRSNIPYGNQEKLTEKGSMSERVKDGRSNRVKRSVKQERYDHGDTNPEGNELDAEVGSFQEVTDKEQSGQIGTKGRAGMKRNSRAGKGRKGIQSENDRAVNSSEESAQPTSDSPQPKNAKRSRRTKRGMSYTEETNSEDDNSEEVSGGAEKAPFKEKRGQKAKQRTARARKEAESIGIVGVRSRLTRSAKSTGSGANPKSRKTSGRLRRVKEEEISEEEVSDGESSEAGGSDCPISGSSEDLDRRKQARTATRARLSKRKSDEGDRGFEKKARRRGHGPGDSDITRSSLKAQSESDEDFVIEGNESSMSEDDKDITDEENDDASGVSASRENLKPKVLQKGKGLSNKEKSPEDEESSDEEVCSVCEFAGAANLMLLCDGENCEQAFHSFCLKLPLQTIPEGDWLCPLCLYERKSKEITGTVVKRTAKLRAKVIPSLKKVEAIIGFREDPSVLDDDNQEERKLQYLVKWCSLSHRHDTWIPEDWLLFADRTRLATYQRRSSIGDGDELSDERRPEWVQIDRVFACRDQDSQCITSPPAAGETQGLSSSKREYLVKWTNIEYNGSTWEEENNDDDMQEAISKFIERHELAEKKACTISTDRDRDVAHAITEQPKYISGGVLHGYQLQGLKWLLSNYQQRKSVILADEMGLGKTIQAVSFIMALKHENLTIKPVLVIGPKSTLVGWEQEFRQWGADLNSLIYQGEKESRSMIRNNEFYTKGRIPLFDVLVTSYDLAMLDNSLLAKFDWSCIIVDEGHRVKNTRSKLGILLRRQTTDFRLLLTGTPVQNTLTELFALLHFLDPNEFPDPERSAQEFSEVDALSGASSKGEGGVEQQISRLHELLTPRMLRRLKADVMQGMIPGKKYVEVMCALTPYQRHLYGAILKKNYKQLNRGNTTGKKRSLNFILMDLKMVCNHPYLFPGKEPDHGDADELFRLLVTASGKLQLLEKLLPRLKEGGHRVLLFSQMTTMLDILEDFLSHMNFKFCRIDGSTVASERQKQIAEFNSANSDLFIFLISTRAGGLGINLPSADTVIIYDPDFNPFVDLQAQARAHRIGQENVVLVYQLITKYSVEEKIIQRSRQKLAMENLVMSKDAKETAADLNTLLLHGARKVLEEHDVEATSVKWTNENIEALMNRDISETKDAKEGGAGYLGAVQGSGGMLGGLSVDKSPVKTGREWDDLLGKLAEQDMEAEEAKLGRGKRQRRRIQYHFEPNINANEDEDEAQDAVEDDPSCSGESASLSESDSDVSLDDEKGRGVRGPYLSKVKSMKEEQGISSSIPQKYSGPLPTSSPSIFTTALTSSKHSGPSKVVPPPSYLPSNPNPSSLTQPTNHSPSLSFWPTSSPPPTKLTAGSSSTQSPGLSHAYFPASHPLAGNDISASPGSVYGSKPYWEYSAPRPPGSSMASVSTSQAYQTLKSPLSSPREHPNPSRSQVHGSPVPYQTAATNNFSQRASPKDLKVTPSPKSTKQSTSPNTLKSPLSVTTGTHGTSPRALKVTTMSKSVQQGTRPPSTSSGPTVVLGGTVQGSFLQQSKEQPCPLDYLPFAEVLRRTGSQLSGSQVSPTSNVLQDAKGLSLGDVLRQTGSPLTGSQISPGSRGLRDAKDLSLEDVLRQTGSSLTASKHVLTTGPPSHLYEEAKNMSLEDVLRRTGATNMRMEDIHKRKGSTAPGTQSPLLQDSTNLSLEEVLRQTGSKPVAPKKDMLPKPPVLSRNVPKLLEPLGDLKLKGSSSTESKQAKSGSLRPSSQVSLDTKSNSSDAVSQQSVATRT